MICFFGSDLCPKDVMILMVADWKGATPKLYSTLPETDSLNLKMDGWKTIVAFLR